MRRHDQIETFKKHFPQVDYRTVQGMLMLQGFISGYNIGRDRFQTEKASFKSETKALRIHIKSLTEQLGQLNRYIKLQASAEIVGEEHGV